MKLDVGWMEEQSLTNTTSTNSTGNIQEQLQPSVSSTLPLFVFLQIKLIEEFRIESNDCSEYNGYWKFHTESNDIQ